MLRTQLCDNLNWTGARQLANMSHALAKLDPANAPKSQDARPELSALLTIARAASAKAEEFNSQELSNTRRAASRNARTRRRPRPAARRCWAYATALCEAPELFQAFAASGTRHARLFKPQEISNTTWAYAKLGYQAPELFDALGNAAARGRAGTHQGPTRPSWTLAEEGRVDARRQLEAVPRRSSRNRRDGPRRGSIFGQVGLVEQFNPQNISNTSWAFSKNRHAHARLFAAMVARGAFQQTTRVEGQPFDLEHHR